MSILLELAKKGGEEITVIWEGFFCDCWSLEYTGPLIYFIEVSCILKYGSVVLESEHCLSSEYPRTPRRYRDVDNIEWNAYFYCNISPLK